MTIESGLQITDIRIRRVDSPSSALKADVSIQLHGALMIHGLQILEDRRGLHVMIPVKRSLDGTFADIADPKWVQAPEKLEDAILTSYRGDDWRSEGSGAGVPDWPPPDYLFGRFVLGQSDSSAGGAV